MRNLIGITVIVLLTAAGLGGCRGGGGMADGVLTVDVTAGYPVRELELQDFMDVEYVALETADEFLTQGVVEDIGKELIVARNYGDGGDIFIFDRATGRGVRSINRRGQGGEEYSQADRIILDEERGEIFVADNITRKIWVYDLYGNFKRYLPYDGDGHYRFMFNYDRDNLISCRFYVSGENKQSEHIIISKQDGNLVRTIPVPLDDYDVTKVVIEREGVVVTPVFRQIIPCLDMWTLMNPSSDTLYNYLPDGDTKPFIVRTPSISSMDTKIFLFPGAMTGRYYFLQTMKKEFNLETMRGFPSADLVYDSEEKAIFKPVVYNGDYSDKHQIYMNSTAVNAEIALWQPLQSDELVRAYNEGRLKGRLAELAAGLDEESNPVIMLIKHVK
jgi:hypothetical protein